MRAVVVGQITIATCVALDFPVDGRAPAAKLARHVADRDLLLDERMEAAAIGEGEVGMASRQATISKMTLLNPWRVALENRMYPATQSDHIIMIMELKLRLRLQMLWTSPSMT
ncbi:hypothetical protein BJF92_13335 [Rhizobium rhizosphaerae]|uniref:Uncharacterized protein n=1 Tax=Xaviernesmea rhizosphaerae TaxID=1672749 RepID=A0A1Q9AHR2_9HYPH|nr:hypothetical protein BJF92_13335 [Xaviernesmea rhizosphaerae]